MRDCFPGHLTASAWVSDQGGTEVLLTHHRKLGIWVQLGGHADGSGDLLMVAKREAYEESGITNLITEPSGERPFPRFRDIDQADFSWKIFDLDIHPIPVYGSVPAHLHFDVRFAFTAPVRIEPCVSRESHDVRWIRIADLMSYTNEPSVKRMASKWIKLRHGVTSDLPSR